MLIYKVKSTKYYIVVYAALITATIILGLVVIGSVEAGLNVASVLSTVAIIILTRFIILYRMMLDASNSFHYSYKLYNRGIITEHNLKKIIESWNRTNNKLLKDLKVDYDTSDSIF